jgi:FkbM family methyltransferase
MKRIIRQIDGAYPLTLIDVGAMGGFPKKWRPVSRDIRVIAFEPDSREFAKLRSDGSIKYLNCALNDKSEELKMFITRRHGNSSLFKPNQQRLREFNDAERFEVVDVITLPAGKVKTLDQIAGENQLIDADFIKIDTQGTELRILRGGQNKVIPRVFGAEIEVEFMQMYEDQPLFREIDAYMNGQGFELIDLRRAFWKRKDFSDYRGKGQLICGDALYFRGIEVFYRELEAWPDMGHRRSKVIKAAVICLIYGMYDYAVSLIKAGQERGHLTMEESEAVIGDIKRYVRRGIFSGVHLNRFVYKAFNFLLRNLRPPSYLGWADSDQEMGNVKAI